MSDPSFYEIAADQDVYPAQPYNTPAILDFGDSINLDIENLLDIGCGDGQLLRFIETRNENVDLFGLTAPGSLPQLLDSKIKILEGDMHALPWPNNFFDAVTARHVLEHSISPYLAIKEIFRVLKPNGTLYAVMPDSSSEWIALWEDHYSVLTPSNWKKLFMDNGFDLVRFNENEWLASHSMAHETEYRFILRKSSSGTQKFVSDMNLEAVNGITGSSSKLEKTDDYSIIVTLHNIMFFETIEELIVEFKENTLIVLPQISGNGWNEMLDQTFEFISKSGWNICYSSKIKSELNCSLLLSPYDYEEILPINSRWRGRFIYGLAKDNWNFSYKNNSGFDFVMTFGPIDSAYLEGITKTIPVGMMRKIPNPIESGPRSRKKLLYLPTYGSNNCLDSFIKVVGELLISFDIAIKLHHGNQYLENTIEQLQEISGIQLISAYENTLECISQADVVVCDASGAIGDSISLSKPTVVLNLNGGSEVDAVQDFLVKKNYVLCANHFSEIAKVVQSSLDIDKTKLLKAKDEIFWATGAIAVSTARNFLTNLLRASDESLLLSLNARRERRLAVNSLIQRINEGKNSREEIVNAYRQQLLKVLDDYSHLKQLLEDTRINLNESQLISQTYLGQLEDTRINLNESQLISQTYLGQIDQLHYQLKTHESEITLGNLRLTQLQYELHDFQLKFQQVSESLFQIKRSRTYRIFTPWRKLRINQKNIWARRN
jgi:SAM-dependent methyltransferase